MYKDSVKTLVNCTLYDLFQNLNYEITTHSKLICNLKVKKKIPKNKQINKYI